MAMHMHIIRGRASVSREALTFDSVRKDLPGGVLECPVCRVLESENCILLHCPRAGAVWDKALEEAGDVAVGTGAAPRSAGVPGLTTF